jgi:hypothetical protein
MAANVLSTLIPSLIGSIQDVARQTGFAFNAATLDATAEAGAIGQTVDYSEIPDFSAVDVTPGVTVPDPTEITTTKKSLTLAAHKAARFKLTAEEHKGLAARSGDFRSVAINNAIGTVLTAAEAYLTEVMADGAGVALGTVGTDPFASNPNILIDAWQGMADDKAPDFDRIAVLSTSHYASAAKLTQFQKLNEAPTGTKFAAGRLGMLAGWDTGYSQAAGVLQTTTAAGSYLINNGGGHAAGTITVTVDTGSGGFAAGDVVTIVGNVYPGTTTLAQMVVLSATSTTITFNRGLYSAVADNASVVRLATHRSSLLAHRSATVLAMRPSAEIPEGDLASMSQIIRDPVTGLALRLAYYPGYHQGSWEVSAVYGAIVRRPSWVRRLIA